MKRYRITVQLEDGDKQQIEEAIKKEYPKLKNTSDLIRTALKEFLKNA